MDELFFCCCYGFSSLEVFSLCSSERQCLRRAKWCRCCCPPPREDNNTTEEFYEEEEDGSITCTVVATTMKTTTMGI